MGAGLGTIGEAVEKALFGPDTSQRLLMWSTSGVKVSRSIAIHFLESASPKEQGKKTHCRFAKGEQKMMFGGLVLT